MKIRYIQPNDYNKGYLDLLYQLSQYKSNINYDDFKSYIDQNKNMIIKVIEVDNKIIGAGSLFILNKIHCNPIGQIEDVVIDQNFRIQGFGKLIISNLVKEANIYNCYKIILNSHSENYKFYKSCGFEKSGFQLKLLC